MQYFDEHMGELFRRASAEIRLRPEDDDWDQIQEGLLPDMSLLSAAEPKGNNRKISRVLMIAFLMFGIIAVIGVILTNQKTKKIGTGVQSNIDDDGGNGKRAVIENIQN